METRNGFTKMTIQEFRDWLKNTKVARTVLSIQQHHTWSPGYSSFKGNNHFELQKGMKDYHVNHHGWSDIGQNFTSFPDGTILTGRSLELSPACIYGNNAHSVCIENLGNFDAGKDQMSDTHRNTIIEMTAALCSKFRVPVTSNGIIYHHWFDLGTGARNNGTKNNKSCPGTNFFGGNKVQDCEKNFLPLVSDAFERMNAAPVHAAQPVYVSVTASTLNIRSGPGPENPKVRDREPAKFGALLRVYEEKNAWYRISNSSQHWVAKQYTSPVSLARVQADATMVRTGPGNTFEKIGSLPKGNDVVIYSSRNNWVKVGLDERWISSNAIA